MMKFDWWQIYLVVGAMAAITSVVLTRLARDLGCSIGFVDKPNSERHKQHEQAVSMLGGAAIFLAWTLTVGSGFVVASKLVPVLSMNVAEDLAGLSSVLPRLSVIFGGAAALAMLGIIDDRRPLGALPKLLGQLAVAGLVAAVGVRITVFFSNPAITWLITMLWIVFIINAVNFFDNMDGLAAGCAAICALFFAVVAGIRDQYFVAVLAAATCGVSAGFLVFNRPPATIFMGDCGSHFLGFMLAVLGALTTFYTPAESPTPAPVIIPFLILALPIFDFFAVVIIRHREKRPIYVGDHAHISHRFVNMGLSRRMAVILIHLLGIALGCGALALLWLPPAGVVIVFIQTAAILSLISILHVSNAIRKKGTKTPC